ncbi:MAG: hypothetical protein PHG03_05580 [Bacilli bacterium]|nr:hypothetical protein [Bacilli bacterium]MDD4796004.1 hypothetical protein [Bacilli bacterium]
MKELDFKIVDDFIMNIYYNFDEVIWYLKGEDYNLNIIIEYLEKFSETFDITDPLLYENILRTKCQVLFKLGKSETGEKMIASYLKDNPKATYAYVELIDDFVDIKNYEKARLYYDLGMAQDGLEDKVAIEERINYFKEE